jgi:glutamate/tyrosine decarboxylase-like PLP-dependent enzyme
LLGLPPEVSFGIATGATMANFTALAAARHHVLAEVEWDVESDGLIGAPKINLILSEEHHVTIAAALRYLGFGAATATLVPVDGHGRMRAGELRTALEDVEGPTIVCTQAGNVNTGSIDPIGEVCDAAHEKGAWVHVDGAFGLWAAAVPSLRYLAEGIERADSWGVDGHKWLNVPYDSAFVFCAHPASHRASMGAGASYLVRSGVEQREALEWVPEFSRRARGFSVYAALKSLGRSGLVELVERCCSHARLFAELLRGRDDVEICNDVVLNQVLVRFLAPGGDHDARTRGVIARVQEDGTCWLGGSKWQGKEVMRISVSNWSTTTEDVEASAAAIARAADSTG